MPVNQMSESLEADLLEDYGLFSTMTRHAYAQKMIGEVICEGYRFIANEIHRMGLRVVDRNGEHGIEINPDALVLSQQIHTAIENEWSNKRFYFDWSLRAIQLFLKRTNSTIKRW